MRGLMSSVEDHVWKSMTEWGAPHVILYARPGPQPSIKITIEVVPADQFPTAEVILEEKGGGSV